MRSHRVSRHPEPFEKGLSLARVRAFAHQVADDLLLLSDNLLRLSQVATGERQQLVKSLLIHE